MINKSKILSRTLVKSATSPAYYTDIISAPLSFSLKFLFALIGLFTLITALSASLPLALIDPQASINTLTSLYPQNLEISVVGGKLSINQPLPYTITSPDPSHQPLVVFDSDSRLGSISNLRDYKAPVIITESAFYTHKSDNGEIRANPIPSDMPNINISASLINQLGLQLQNNFFVRYRLYSLFVFLFILIIMFFPLTFASLVIIFLFSLVAYPLSRILNRQANLSFAKIFQVSIHSLSILYLTSFLLGFIGVTIPFYLIFLTYLAFTFWGLSYYHPTTTTDPQSPISLKKTTTARRRHQS